MKFPATYTFRNHTKMVVNNNKQVLVNNHKTDNHKSMNNNTIYKKRMFSFPSVLCISFPSPPKRCLIKDDAVMDRLVLTAIYPTPWMEQGFWPLWLLMTESKGSLVWSIISSSCSHLYHHTKQVLLHAHHQVSPFDQLIQWSVLVRHVAPPPPVRHRLKLGTGNHRLEKISTAICCKC